MPAINVARTDTFEQQRVKINQISNTLFQVTSGGSDLATGNLKLGDGTRFVPSLSFTSDDELGIYKSGNNSIGFVSDTKKLLDITQDSFISYKDTILRKNIVITSGITITNVGSNYDPGDYVDIPLVGGTGSGATAAVKVVPYSGTIISAGANYNSGLFSGVNLVGGTGTGAVAEFTVDDLDGTITNSGSAYAPGNYLSVPLTGGTGTGALADIIITGNTILGGSITQPGSGYTTGTYNNVDLYNIPRQTFIVKSVPNPNAPPPNNVYEVDGTIQPVLTMEIGNTYRFDISDVSMNNHPLYFQDAQGNIISQTSQFQVVIYGFEGTPGAFVDLIVRDTAVPQSIVYNCTNHNGMGNSINIVAGTPGSAGFGATADVIVDNSGVVSTFTFVNSGNDYTANDQVTFLPASVGGVGSGFVFTLSQPTFDGTVTNCTIVDDGQDYSLADVLSASDSDLGNGGGSGFAFTVNTDPGKISDFEIVSFGNGYSVGDSLTLSTGVQNQSTILPGTFSGIATTLTAGVSQITIADTTGIQAGMTVFGDQGDIGQLGQNTSVLSVDSATTLTLSVAPTVSGSASLSFVSQDQTLISISDVSGISVGFLVEKVSGSGVLADNTLVATIDTQLNTITLSQQPTTPGPAVLNFVPAYGIGTTPFQYDINTLGSVDIDTFAISDGGNGYSDTDVLTITDTDLTQPIDKVVVNKVVQILEFSGVSSSALNIGDTVKIRDGSIITTLLTLSSTILAEANQVYSSVPSTGGNGTGATFNIERDPTGAVITTTVALSGFDYQVNDTLVVLGSLVGGVDGVDDIQFQIDSVTLFPPYEVLDIETSGGNIDRVLIENADYSAGDVLIFSGTGNTSYTPTVYGSPEYKWVIDGVLAPDLTLYVGDSYRFDLSDSSNGLHDFGISAFEGGSWSPSRVENVSTVLSDTSRQITVADTTNILVGMQVTSSGLGQVQTGTFVESIDGPTTLTLTLLADVPGSTVLTFSGVPFEDGVVKEANALTIKITPNTPSPLYYYDSTDANGHREEAQRLDGTFATLTIDPNNPKTFGSGFSLTVNSVDSTDIVSLDNDTGVVTAVQFTGDSVSTTSGTISGTLTAPDIAGQDLAITNITGAQILVDANRFTFESDVRVGSNTSPKLTIAEATGNIDSFGSFETTSFIEISSQLHLETNVVSTNAGFDLELEPPVGRVIRSNSSTALIIPAGDTSSRPVPGVVADGAIRFNTQTNQYEGYSSATTTWSSLGGVRDLDGNTTILAEEFVGANDNTLWFYNDNINTIKVSNEYLEFVNCKKISSSNVSAPSYREWNSNIPVLAGEYLKYKSNLFEVITSGVTASAGTPPTDLSGNTFTNGSAELAWWGISTSSLTFEEISEVRIGPTESIPLSINNDLRLLENVISTDTNDLIFRPNSGKKIVCDAESSLVLPVGVDSSRGVAVKGSIRFSETSSQFEGYDGTNWGSLGGVKDVDQNTYIIPELAPGTNENILYFYNDNNNTLQVTTNALDFYSIDTIRSIVSDEFEITASLLTFDNGTSTFDNTDANTTFLHTSKKYFDLGLSAGLTTDPVLRLDDQGDVYLNIGFGTGVFDGVKVFDGDLKEFELADIRILTDKIRLVKGTVDQSTTDIYDVALNSGSKTSIIAENVSTGEKEYIEFGILDNGTDVFHTEYGNVRTGTQLFVPTFEVTGANVVRINISIGAAVGNTETVDITVVSNVTKK